MAKNVNKKENHNNEPENGRKQYFNLDAEKAFFEEVDEEVRNEKFKQLINKYGGIIMFIMIVALSIAVGYEKIGEWRIRKAEQKNIQYAQALVPNENYENNINELENIVATEKGLYKDMAHLQIANILLDNNQTERAIEVLTKIYQDPDTIEKIREIAIIKLATYKIDTASYEDMNALLSPIMTSETSTWKATAKELLAMSAIDNKNYETAKQIYQELLANDNISDEFRGRINDMLALINSAKN